MKELKYLLKVGAVVIAFFTCLGIIGNVFGFFGEAAVVAQKEFGPKRLLEKYEWFKDASAALDAKKADIRVYESRVKDLGEVYAGRHRADWPREDREQMSLWMSEVAGVKASYNSLASEYNSQMAKFNWRFTNAETLPKGADKPLPKEYKPYETN